jgi:hypothetical protein
MLDRGRVFRPSITLFVYLKLRRATGLDLADIRVAVDKCPEGFDETKFLAWSDAPARERYEKLRRKLGLAGA